MCSPVDIASLFPLLISNLINHFIWDCCAGTKINIISNLNHVKQKPFVDSDTHTEGFLNDKLNNHQKEIYHYKLHLNYGESAGVVIPGKAFNG